ncbi:unnamed protein product [Oncorhynchus mykiss]|uniref:VPS9 domain-containing protein n=1 Tax=Oncorhynchus mykiss TaxID=8022 RepID=A0A060WHF1_ONCMY|nr:unnamed protein product [Oncorhynchus mykiss]
MEMSHGSLNIHFSTAFSLERSGLSFADLFHLVAFCCISRDVLPFTLKLPEAISAARTPTDLEVAKLGAGFWDSERCRRRSSLSSLSRTTTHDQSPSLRQRSVYTPLVTRTPSQLECSQSNGALCFINPLFLKVHHPEGGNHTFPSYTSHNDNTQHLNNSSTTTATTVQTALNPIATALRVIALAIAPSIITARSMPEKISWINPPKEKEKVAEREKGSSLLSRLGSTLSISPSSSFLSSSFLSSSPPKKRSISAPISIPLSLSSPSDVDCRLVLDDQTIENAISLSLAKRALRNATTPDENTEGNSPSTQDQALSCREEGGGRGRGGREEDCIQRLSDMSISTDSTDSEDDDEDEADFGVSVENDQDQDLTITPPGLRTKRRASAGAMVIQQALRGHFRKMSGVFSSLLTPEKRAIRRVLELSRDKGSYFGCLVQDYLSFLQEGGGCQAWQCHASGLELLQTLRQFITQMKSYLRQSSELEPPIESLIPEDQIDYVLEKAMHKIVLKPLKGVVGVALQEFQVRSGAWQELKENLSLAKARQPHEMGVANAFPPDPVNIEKIRHKFHTMCKLYSPEKKVTMLLRVCKLIYTIMEHKSGCLYGADDFLPMLTYVLAQCDMPQLDNEILYMMEVLDPSLLHGEGGYYLTSAYGAMSLIRNFQEEQAARVLSSETRNTLRQWHCRRTTQRSAPSVNDFQNYLRVALQDSGCTAKTLQVQPYATTEEICQICAYKFKVPDPENYALILLTEGSCQQLAPDTHPQKIKAELHSQPQAAPFHFVFCRVANLNDLAATSFEPQSNLNDIPLTKESEPNLMVWP